MEIIRGLSNLSHHFNQCVITLGNFDGIHLGHQALITRLKQVGQEKNLPTIVMLFEPQPLEFFNLTSAPSRLTSFREKCSLMQALGIDFVLAIPFNQTFANMSAQRFIEQGLIKQLNAQYVIVGDDFRFGAKRQGDIALLKQYAKRPFLKQSFALESFILESMPSYVVNNQRVSSTAVRKALLTDNFTLAKTLLGRDYTIQGRVTYGYQLARQLGFPTANIHLNRKNPALHGVYFVKVKDFDSSADRLSKTYSPKEYTGIANIGIRPTINGKNAILEVNIFDFQQDIYGHYLEVQFIAKIRDEVKFDSLPALQAQIKRDICIARQIAAKF